MKTAATLETTLNDQNSSNPRPRRAVIGAFILCTVLEKPWKARLISGRLWSRRRARPHRSNQSRASARAQSWQRTPAHTVDSSWPTRATFSSRTATDAVHTEILERRAHLRERRICHVGREELARAVRRHHAVARQRGAPTTTAEVSNSRPDSQLSRRITGKAPISVRMLASDVCAGEGGRGLVMAHM